MSEFNKYILRGFSQSGISACGTPVSSLGAGAVTARRNGTGTSGSVQRRSNYRILSDMPDEDWGIPDMCLQKTAEVNPNIALLKSSIINLLVSIV